MTTESEFHALSYEQQAVRIEQLARVALREYDVDPTSVVLLQHAENTSFRVESALGTFNLRVSRPGYQSVSNVQSEIAWLTALSADGFPVPAPYRSELVVASTPGVPEARTCVLFQWMDGEFRRGGLSADEAASVGRIIARLHGFVRQWPLPTGFDRQDQHAWADADGDGPFEEPSAALAEQDRDLLRDVWKESVDLVHSTPRTPDIWGLIHADLHSGNILFEGDRVNLIDFDDASFAYFVYDFAAALAYEPLIETCDALLRGYEEVRPLPPGTRDLLNPFLRLRSMNVASWLINRTDNPRLQEVARKWVPSLCDGIRACA